MRLGSQEAEPRTNPQLARASFTLVAGRFRFRFLWAALIPPG